MSRPVKLGVWVLVGVIGVALLLWLRGGDEGEPAAARTAEPASAKASPRAQARAPAPRPSNERPTPPPATEPAPVEERRDHTGELLSDGPAQQVSLPERPEGATDNTPAPEQSEAVMREVIARLDGEIAAAKASGDEAEAGRLQVRRDRLERKLAERGEGEDAPPG